MKIVTTAQMRELDRRTIEAGTPGAVLMERAGGAVTAATADILRARRGYTALVFAGKGNNGGDAFVAARNLRATGFRVAVALCCHRSELKGDALTHFQKLEGSASVPLADENVGQAGSSPHSDGVEIVEISSAKETLAIFQKTQPTVVVDGLLGTGIEGAPRPPLSEIIDAINFHELPVVAIDIPSGMNSDTGEAPGAVINAETTVTMGLPKLGLLRPEAWDLVGELRVADIGIPRACLNDVETDTHLITAEDVRRWLPRRKRSAHKGDFGHVLVLAGSEGYTGAAVLCAEAATRAGAGLVTLGVPRRVYPIIAAQCREVMLRPLADTETGGFSVKALEGIDDLISRVNVVALGPGLGQHPETREFVLRLVQRCLRPMVLDADALNAVSYRTAVLKEAKAPVVVTPHPGEMARLIGRKSDDIQADRWAVARRFAADHRVVCVLKGAGTVVARGDSSELWLNATGNPSMAKGGSGDVLTGLLAGLMAQGLTPFDVARAAVYLHGLAGDVAEETAERAMVASELSDCLGRAFQMVALRQAGL
jgi:NAD(P)H-hydrate epimerase